MRKPQNTFNQKEKKIFFTLISFFLVFLIFKITSDSFLFIYDSEEYLYVAGKLHDFSFFSPSTDIYLTTKRPLIYPLFLTVFYDFPIVVTAIFQTLLSISTFYFIFKIIKSYQIEIKYWYLCFFIFTPSIFIYSQTIIPASLVMFFLTMLFWLLRKKWSTKNFLFIQIITILLAFTKPVFYPLIYLNFLFFTIYFIKNRTFSFWIFLPIIVLQIYLTSNERRTGYRHFSSIENINLVNFNLFYFKSNYESGKKADLWLDSMYNSTYKEKSFREQNIYLREIATNEIKENFISYSYYHLFTAVRGVFDPGRFDLMTFFKNDNGRQGFLEILNGRKSISVLLKDKFIYLYLLLIPIFFINLLKWFYFLKYVFTKKLDLKIYYLISILASYILITGPVNTSKYMMPFQVIIIVFAFLGMKTKIKKSIV